MCLATLVLSGICGGTWPQLIRGVSYLETKIWAMDVFLALRCPYFTYFSDVGDGSIVIPLKHSPIHLSVHLFFYLSSYPSKPSTFSPVHETPLTTPITPPHTQLCTHRRHRLLNLGTIDI